MSIWRGGFGGTVLDATGIQRLDRSTENPYQRSLGTLETAPRLCLACTSRHPQVATVTRNAGGSPALQQPRHCMFQGVSPERERILRIIVPKQASRAPVLATGVSRVRR